VFGVRGLKVFKPQTHEDKMEAMIFFTQDVVFEYFKNESLQIYGRRNQEAVNIFNSTRMKVSELYMELSLHR
jgi:hypothetical protein